MSVFTLAGGVAGALPDAQGRYRTAFVLAILAVAAAALVKVGWDLQGYNYTHAWVSAHFAVMARAFAAHGILALGGVPIQNEGLLTASPDAYVNWPPLYPMLLAGVFRLFGEAERVQHLLATGLVLATAGVVFALGRLVTGSIAAAGLGAVALLAAPIVAAYAHLGLHLHLAILLMVAALACFAVAQGLRAPAEAARRRRWIAAALATAALAAFTSWEPVLAAPGLVLVALLRRDWRALRLALLFGVAAVAGAASVFVLYGLEYGWFADAIFQRLALRAGFGDGAAAAVPALASPHFVQEHAETAAVPPLGSYFIHTVLARLAGLGTLGHVGVVMAPVAARSLWRSRPGLAYVATGLASVYLLWAVGMRNHMQIHDYQALLLAPLGAVCVCALAAHVLDVRRRGVDARAILLFVALPVVALVAAFSQVASLKSSNAADDAETRFAAVVRAAVEPDAIVVHPSRSMVPVYAMQRHTVRAIADQATLDEQRGGILALCPSCPVYLAVPQADAAAFPALTTQEPVVRAEGLGAVYRLAPAP